jgi:hypothetical protein
MLLPQRIFLWIPLNRAKFSQISAHSQWNYLNFTQAVWGLPVNPKSRSLIAGQV